MCQDWLTIEEKGEDVVLTKCSPDAKGEIVIPDGVTSISVSVFSGCSGLTSIEIPVSVTSIGSRAFSGCSGLTSIEIPVSVTSIGFQAFGECRRLTSIALPDCEMSCWSFDACPVDSIRLCASVKSIENTKGLFETYERLSVLDFMGSIPETNGVFANSWIETLRVNTPLKKTTIPDDIKSALHLDDYKNRGEIIYAAPELCEEQSQVPGYIRATLAKNDEVVDINTKYIVSVEPYKLNRYTPITGSLIVCAASSIEKTLTIAVYEPCDMILKKIEDSLEALGKKVGGVAGLLNLLETLCKKNR